jgi:hypothetical protein
MLRERSGRRRYGHQYRYLKVSSRYVIGSFVFTVNKLSGHTQGFMKFECASAKDEINKRFEFFTTHVGSRNSR